MRRGRLIGLTAAVSLVALIYGGYVWWESRKHVATDDAYVEGNVVVISAKVAGHVASIHVDDNRAVKAGDLLLRIDPRDYAAKRDQARAAVAVAAASQQATRSETQLTRETTAAQVEEARAALERAGVERTQATAIYEILREGDEVRFRRAVPYPAHAQNAVRAALEVVRRAATAEEYEIATLRPQ